MTEIEKKMTTVILSDERRRQYKLVEDAYTGDGGFADGSYIYEYGRELDIASRRAMASYSNYFAPIVDAKVDPVFSGNITRDYDSNMLEVFLEDADNNEATLEQKVKHATLHTVLNGNAFIIVDNFPEEDQPKTEREALESRILPYVYTKTVRDVFSYSVDGFGRLMEIVFYYGVDRTKEGKIKEYLFKRYTDTDIEIYSVTAEQNRKKDHSKKKIVGGGKTPTGRIPVIYYNKDNILPFSPHYSMSTLCRDIYNSRSEVKDLSRSQNFSILVLPSSAEGDEAKEAVVVSNHNAIFVDSDATVTPSYISPDSSILTTQLEKSKSEKEDLLQTADVLGTTSVATGGAKASSGVAESYRFFGKKEALNASQKIATYYDEKTVELVLEIYSTPAVEYVVNYPDNFSPTFTETTQKVDLLEKVVEMDISEYVTQRAHVGIVELVGEFMAWEDEEMTLAIESITLEPAPVDDEDLDGIDEEELDE